MARKEFYWANETGYWHNPAKWDRKEVPGPEDNATIGGGECKIFSYGEDITICHDLTIEDNGSIYMWTANVQLVCLTDSGFSNKGIECPDQKVYVSVEVPTFDFKKATYEFKKTDDPNDPFKIGQLFWEGGMQSHIVEEVLIFTDDIEEGLFVAANAQNDPTCPFLFAKLLPCELHDIVMGLFTKHMAKLA